MKIPTHVDFMGKAIDGNFDPMEILEILDKKIVEMKNKKEGV